MDHLFLLRKQAHELNMRQMVEEITFGCHTIESAMSKYQVLTRSTVTKFGYVSGKKGKPVPKP